MKGNGSLLKASEYYHYVNERFIKRNQHLFDGCDEKMMVRRPVPDGLFDGLLKLLDKVQEKYGFNMQKMCAPNYNKFIFWQEEFCKTCRERELLAATKFIVFCCLADKFLDSARFADCDKECICEKLQSKYFISDRKYVSDKFPELDELLNDIRVFLTADDITGSPEWELIVASMDKAFVSEIYMYRNPLRDRESFDKSGMSNLTDKSVEFETAAFLMATIHYNSDRSRRAAACAGRISWLADDLADFVEDVNRRIRNSVLFYCVDNSEELFLTDRVEKAFDNIDCFIERLEYELADIKGTVGRDLYTYLLNEVWEWCSDVRKFSE